MAGARPDSPLAVAVRPAAPADAGTIARWLNRARVRRYLTSNLRHGGMTAALVRAGLRRPDQSWHVIEADGTAAGMIAFDGIDREDGVANMWYLIGEERFAGRGVASAAIARILADNPLGLVTVTAWVGAPNAASVRCLEKAGFREVGRITAAFRLEEGRFDRIVFEKVLAPR